MRLTEEEARMLGILPEKKKKGGKSKYNARKTQVDGIKFDSQAEANFYCELKILQRAGKIDGFCRQARFVVTEGDEDNRGSEYVVDFVIFYPDGHYRIVDVKGMETNVFKLKVKAMHEKYPKLKVELER